jgi:hypothetical protein
MRPNDSFIRALRRTENARIKHKLLAHRFPDQLQGEMNDFLQFLQSSARRPDLKEEKRQMLSELYTFLTRYPEEWSFIRAPRNDLDYLRAARAEYLGHPPSAKSGGKESYQQWLENEIRTTPAVLQKTEYYTRLNILRNFIKQFPEHWSFITSPLQASEIAPPTPPPRYIPTPSPTQPIFSDVVSQVQQPPINPLFTP